MEYTIREAAALAKVSTNTVRSKIKSGVITARLEIDKQLCSVIYKIPVAELEKIKAEPGRRTDLL